MVGGSKEPLTYRDAGVDIDAVQDALKTVGELAHATRTPRVLAGIGSFGALFRADFQGLREPVLVSSTDGVGTKLLLACRMGRFDTVGADLVNHCINDILVMGAEPLFFLDYVAADRFAPGMLESIVGGFARACREQGVALIGGETAEMPGLYPPGHFDLAGFIVGVAERSALLTPERVRDGDLLLGLRSSGLHTNGYSLAQRILFEQAGLSPEDRLEGADASLGDLLLATHRCYRAQLAGLLADEGLHGLVHVTGGGFTDNLPRVLPEGLGAVVNRDAWNVPRLFVELARRGPVERDEMDRTFNMGIGMLLVVAPEAAERLAAHCAGQGEDVVCLGRVEAGDRQVRYEGAGGL